MNKHTPGPWVESCNGWIDGADGSSVTEYAGCGSHEAEYSSPADKALILAAPDLLEALEAMVRTCDAGKRPIATRKKARQAIAKARGQS